MYDILQLVEARGYNYEVKSSEEIAITCPNAPYHSGGVDDKPSFGINLSGKGAHCFACGLSLSPEGLVRWLAGEDLDSLDVELLALKAKLSALSSKEKSTDLVVPVFLPPGEPFKEYGYRGISKETYEKLGAIHVTQGRYKNRIAFPVYVNGELKGIDARTLVNDYPKYLRNKQSTCKTNWLYPYDLVKASKPSYVILAEGIFHSINGVDKNFPVLAFFGANNWSRNKVMMLLSLGVDEVIYFPDPDKAGFTAMQQVCSMLKDWFVVTVADTSLLEVLSTDESKLDLADLSAAQIEFCLSRRKEPILPECLPDGKVTFGERCNKPICPFCVANICTNHYWRKDTSRDSS